MDYIERFYARDFFCIRELDIALTPLHAFIGPNDSGKSTILRAIRTLVNYGNRSPHPLESLGSRSLQRVQRTRPFCLFEPHVWKTSMLLSPVVANYSNIFVLDLSRRERFQRGSAGTGHGMVIM